MKLHHAKYEKHNGIARVTLNRPEVLNALNANTITDLDAIVNDAAADGDVGVILLTGEGERAFAAGADIQELVAHDAVTGKAMSDRGQRVFRNLETMGKPSIAAINGFALGGGCELAMACTIRIASDKARLGQPEINLGTIPGYAGSQRLPRLVGKGIAMDLTLTGRMVDAAEALRIGLVSRVVPHEELPAAAQALAEELLSKGPLALKAAMDVVDRGYDIGLDDASNLEAAHFGVLCATEDMQEGLKAFLEKRTPNFKGK
ncbi:MAG: enoyl-CoA hydratase-related protein [bacterium]|nr:enoyl-CoA hydratase-related protein [bacterium]